MSDPDTRLAWRASDHAKRLLTLGALLVLLGLATGRYEVVALAAVPIAFLCRRRAAVPDDARWHITTSAATSFEDEPVTLTVGLEAERPLDVVDVAVAADRFVDWTGGRATACDAAAVELLGPISVRRWGRRGLGSVTATLTADSGLRRVTLRAELPELATFPQPTPADRLSITPLRGGLGGDHRGRRTGAGVEFAGLRPYGPGDAPSRVNWPTSLRLQQLHVTQRLTEEALDVVLVVDALTDVGMPGRSTLDLSLRGATGLARALLRSHDRVGLVALGGRLRWLRPESGTRQFYRVAAAVLDVIDRPTYVDPDVGRLPPSAVPSGAHVVMFSPLLDRRAIAAIEPLRVRGVMVTVVDVLTSRPTATERIDQLVLRWWRLSREATAHALAGIGVLVVAWDGEARLDVLLRPALTGQRTVVWR